MGLVSFLREALANGARPSTPPGLIEHLPVNDDPVEHGTGASTDPVTVTIEYVDSKGEDSLRTITIYAVERTAQDKLCLRAECHARERGRTFRVDRIQTVIDEQGEVFDDPEAYLRSALGDEAFDQGAANTTHRKPKSATNSCKEDPLISRKEIRAQFREEARPFTRVLVAIARADGRYSKGEDVPITTFLLDHVAPIEFDNEDRAWVGGYVRRMNPTPEHVEVALADVAGRIRESRQTGERNDEIDGFVRAIREVIYADGEVDYREVTILRELVELAV